MDGVFSFYTRAGPIPLGNAWRKNFFTTRSRYAVLHQGLCQKDLVVVLPQLCPSLLGLGCLREDPEHGGTAAAHRGAQRTGLDHGIFDCLDFPVLVGRKNSLKDIERPAGNPQQVPLCQGGQGSLGIRAEMAPFLVPFPKQGRGGDGKPGLT